MTEPSEAAKAKALELYRAAAGEPQPSQWQYTSGPYWREACEQLVQQVSDAAKIVRGNRSGCNACDAEADSLLTPFILPEPVDPLAEILNTCAFDGRAEGGAAIIRAELAKRGYQIVKDET